MIKYLFFFVLAIYSFMGVQAQKKEGVIYTNHEAISKTKAQLAAFAKRDFDTYTSYFADSVIIIHNGDSAVRSKQDFKGVFNWWNGMDHLTVKDDSQRSPIAYISKDGELWVQNWLNFTGTHNKSGVNFEGHMHNLYHFNKDMKIDKLYQYYDEKMFDQVNNSDKTTENGTVYINHPYINTVRKCVNAWCAEDIPTLTSFYAPDAWFMQSSFKATKPIKLEDKMKQNKQNFDAYDNIKLEQWGYPDCIYYEKDDAWVVNSWWILSVTTKDGVKKSDIPVMMSHVFNKDGKITWEAVYVSSNHFQ